MLLNRYFLIKSSTERNGKTLKKIIFYNHDIAAVTGTTDFTIEVFNGSLIDGYVLYYLNK